MIARAMLVLAAAVCVAASGFAEARSGKPKVPPGRDPGGIAVALIGGGIDYRMPELAARLARDGEGELIGWDIADNDRQPYASANDDGPLASRLIGDARDARLVPVRVMAGRHDQIAAALGFTGGTPARIVIVAAEAGAPLPLAGLAEAARSLPGLLIVVPARRIEAGPPTVAERAGLLVVAAGPHAGSVADLVVTPVEAPSTAPSIPITADDLAAIRVAALAARLAAVEPALSGAALRARILGVATPQSPGPPAIADPAAINWRK